MQRMCTTLFIQHSEITLTTDANRTTTSPSFNPAHTPHPLPSTSQDNDLPTIASRDGTRIDWYTFPERWSAGGGELTDMELLGISLTASSAFGCMLVNHVGTQDAVIIPGQLRVWRTYL